MKISLVLLTLLYLAWKAQCAKILFVAPVPAYSHFSLSFSLAKEMADRGHEVTVINPYPQKKPIKNYRDVSVEEIVDFMEGILKDLLTKFKGNFLQNINVFFEMTIGVTERTLKNENVQALLNSEEKFDLVVVAHFMNEALIAIGSHFKAPIVILSSLRASNMNNYMFSNPAPLSYVPSFGGQSSKQMNFWQRLQNLLMGILTSGLIEFFDLPQQRKLVKDYISPDINLDDVINNNISLMLTNSHISIGDPIPTVPAIIEIGGFHVHFPKKLPEDLQEFLDSSKEGVVLFSMGSNLRSKDFKPEAKAAVLNAFSKIKQKVLWKFETELPEAPPNVKIMSWLPQQDILAHPNVKAFITHGGLLSTIETIYHGVPIVGIPVYGDQKSNIAGAVSDGYALSVSLDDITEEIFSKALDEILNNPKYRENVKQRSKLMHDRPIKPMDSAVYWLEHVIRHKGAPHLRSAGLDLTWYQREMIDVIGFLIFVVVAILLLLQILIKKLIGFLWSKKNRTLNQKKKKQN